MFVSMWMTRDVLTVGVETPLTDVARLMSEKRIRRPPVFAAAADSDQAHPAGMITATDVLHAFPAHVNPFAVVATPADRTCTRVADLLLREPVVVAPDAPLEPAADLTCRHKIGGLPVVKDGRLSGVITELDIFRAFVSLFAASHSGLRITFDIAQCERPFAFVAQLAAGRAVESKSVVSSREDGVPVAVVRVEGSGAHDLVDALWRAKRRVLSVLPVRRQAGEPLDG